MTGYVIHLPSQVSRHIALLLGLRLLDSPKMDQRKVGNVSLLIHWKCEFGDVTAVDWLSIQLESLALLSTKVRLQLLWLCQLSSLEQFL
ncbi:hypothetical protein U1Q18_019092 [Sarracenia purpurea var. burkii]